MAASFGSLGVVEQPVGGREDVTSGLRVKGSQVSVNQLADDSDLTQNEKVLLRMNVTRHKYRRWGKYGLAAIFLAGGMLSSAFIGFVMRHGSDALSRKALYDSWGIASRQDSAWESPTPQQMDDRLDKLGMLGKELTAVVASRTEYDNRPVPQPKGREAMEALAMHVSGGKTSNLIGETVYVKDVQILGSDTIGRSPIPLKVTRYLSETDSTVTLEVTDVNTGKLLALNLNIGDVQPNNPVSGCAANLLGSLRVMQETTAVLQAAGSTPLEKATAERALDVIAGVGTLEGLPPVLDSTHVHLLNTVHISERLRGRLADIFIPENRMPDNAKEYAAKRILLAVLQLQRAGFSHNRLHLGNFRVRFDGSCLLTGFGAGTLIGEALDRVETVDPRYAERELGAAATRKSSLGASHPVVDAKTDLWGLGITLYQLFTDGELPYGLRDSASPVKTLNSLAAQGVRASSLEKSLRMAKVPVEWQPLIMDLLELERKDRIDIVGLLSKYSVLIYS